MKWRRTRCLLDLLLSGVEPLNFRRVQTASRARWSSRDAGIDDTKVRIRGALGRRSWCVVVLERRAPTFDELVARVTDIAPEIAIANGFAHPGDEIEIRIVAERVHSVLVSAAA